VPTIATSVPPAAFSFATERLKRDAELGVPLCTSNRINRAEIAERVLSSGAIDLVSMARPLLADPDFVRNISTGEPTNGCIGCNQSCLDHVFVKKRASCLVNPRAAHETEMPLAPTTARKDVLVVGGGPAGMSCAVTLAQRGHTVDARRGERHARRSVQHGEARAGQERFPDDDRLLHREAQAPLGAGAAQYARRRGVCAGAGLRHRRGRHRRHAAPHSLRGRLARQRELNGHIAIFVGKQLRHPEGCFGEILTRIFL
jgi:hypothetical protein